MRCGYCGEELVKGDAFCGSCGAKVDSIPKRKHAKVALKIAGALAIIAVVLVVSWQFSVGSKKDTVDKQLVYIKNETLYYVPNVKKEKEPLEVYDVDYEKNAGYNWYSVQLSSDGNYVYFMDNREADGVGELCRIKTGKIKKNADKNEKHVEELCSNVKKYTVLDESEKVLCLKSNDKLVLIDQKEEDIDRDVYDYQVYQDKVIYSMKSKKDGAKHDLYAYDVKNGKNQKLEKGLDDYYTYSTDFIIGCKEMEEEDSFGTLYEIDAKGKSDKIAEQAEIIHADAESKSLYYVKINQTEEKLYDYVTDAYAEEDDKIIAVNPQDFMTEVTEGQAVSPSDYSYYDLFDPEEREWFYDDLDYNSELEMYSYWNSVARRDYYYNELTNKWYFFDETAYETAQKKYESISDRIILREKLKNQKYQKNQVDLYFYESGKEPILVVENITDCQANAANKFALYQKGAEQEKITMDSLLEEAENGYYDLDDEDELLYLMRECGLVEKYWNRMYAEKMEDGGRDQKDDSWYYLEADKERELKDSTGLLQFSANGKSFVTQTKDGELVLYSKKGDEVKEVNEIADDAQKGAWIEDAYYYYVDAGKGNGDLCCYKNGENSKIAKNVSGYSVCRYTDGNFMIHVGSGDKLEFYNAKGERKRISKNASEWSYLDKNCIVYKSDEDLYVYTGKDEEIKIDRDVTCYDCNQQNGKSL